MHLLNAHLAELSKSSLILVLPELLNRILLFLHSLHLLNTHLEELQRILSDFDPSELTKELLQLHLVHVLNAHLA
jgi:hypothetical protein